MPNSNTVKVKTADLSDLALDWAVAKCEGHHWRVGDRYPQYAPGGTSCWMTWRVSSDWAQAWAASGGATDRNRLLHATGCSGAADG